jgi:hypothetical protein
MRHWQEYLKVSYDLILESEGQTKIFLANEVEAYLVHLFARNFERTDIYQEAIALRMLSVKKRDEYLPIADECLIIDSWPIKHKKWPSENYFKDMGSIAYGLAGLSYMEQNFTYASVVLRQVLNKKLQ